MSYKITGDAALSSAPTRSRATSHPAVNHKLRSRHVVGGVGGEEQHAICDVLSLSSPAERHPGTPGDNEPSGFILTTILGIVGAFLATYLGQAIGWYRPDEGAGLIGAVVGAVIILLIWGFISGRRRPSP